MNCKTCAYCFEPRHLKLLVCEQTLEIIAKGQDIYERAIDAPEWCPKVGALNVLKGLEGREAQWETLSGGLRTEVYYFDDQGNAVNRGAAVR